MLISTKGRYAVRILLDVALHEANGAVKIAEISARQEISAKYAEQITGMLVKGGLLRSIRGAGGGYVLQKRPEQYTVAEILQKTEGDLAPVGCVTDPAYCRRQESCVTARLWSGLYQTIREYLNGITLRDLADDSTGYDYSI